ncbi:hypothetical protein ACHAP5_009911 [Fusarium lateritium]
MRQTCRVLRELANKYEFYALYGCLWYSIRGFYNISQADFDQLHIVKQIFLRESLCKPCGNLFDSGEVEKRLWTLWQPVHCTGCKKSHPAFLFPQGQHGGNLCVGTIGHFAPCKHVKISGRLQSRVPEGDDIGCGHYEHFPANSGSTEQSTSSRFTPYVCVRPEHGPGHFKYQRAFSLLKIHQSQFPGMQALKLYLLKQLEELGGDGLCQHAPSQFGSIVACLISDRCDCFPTSGIPAHKPVHLGSDWTWCQNHDYICPQCGARYFWGYEEGYILLFVRIGMKEWQPDNSVWLANLSFDTDEHPILNDNTKGVLWCNDPSCGTGCGKRWLRMTCMLKSTLQWRGDFAFIAPRRLRLPLTLEFQIYRDAASWLGGSGMPRDFAQMLLTLDPLQSEYYG